MTATNLARNAQSGLSAETDPSAVKDQNATVQLHLMQSQNQLLRETKKTSSAKRAIVVAAAVKTAIANVREPAHRRTRQHQVQTCL